MKKDLKQRIEQINAGTVPAGYKKTKVGIVPEDWDEKKGTELFSYIRNGFVGTVSPYYVADGHTYIQGNNIKDGKIIPDNMMFVNDEFFQTHPNSILHEGDIIVIQSGDVGKCAVVTSEYENANCHALIIMTPHTDTNSVYISYLLNSSFGLNMIKGYITGNVLHHILASDYKSIKYALPPLPEQQKIAEILTTQDSVISLLQKRIELKQQQKKALMQKLLSGEVRVGDGEWKKKRLRLVARVFDGTHQTPNYQETGIIFVSVENINDLYGSNKFISQNEYETTFKNNRPELNDVLMTRIGDIGTPALIISTEPLAFYVSLALIKCGLEVIPPYLLYYIQSSSFQKELWKRTLHIAFPKKINKDDIGECIVNLPPLPEQEKIAEILSAQDREIELMQQQLALEQQKKKALMQLLLTGKVRCV